MIKNMFKKHRLRLTLFIVLHACLISLSFIVIMITNSLFLKGFNCILMLFNMAFFTAECLRLREIRKMEKEFDKIIVDALLNKKEQ